MEVNLEDNHDSPETNLETSSDIEPRAKWLKPLQGILVFLIMMVTLAYGGSYFQIKWGMYGVALTELMILLFAIISALILGKSLREVFPFKKPTLKGTLATVLLWVGSFLPIMTASLILITIFMDGFSQVSEQLGNVITSVPVFISWIIVAIMPAVCEEALHRGLLLHTFKDLKKKWVIILIMGLIFGIFHLDPYRFLPTALLGVALTYLMLETNNLFYPMLFHLINNTVSVLSSFTALPQNLETAQNMDLTQVIDVNTMLITIGAFTILSSVSPVLLKLAAGLLGKKVEPLTEEERKAMRAKQNKTWIKVIIFTLVLFVLGIVLMSIGMANTDLSQWQP